MKKEPQKSLSIRITEQEYQTLCQIAEEERRFVSRQAAYLVKCALREYDSSEKEGMQKEGRTSVLPS